MPTLRFSMRERRHVGAVEQHLAAGVGRLQAGDDAQRRGLAAAGGPEEHHRLAGVDRQVERLQRARAVGERLGAALQRDRDGFGGVGNGVTPLPPGTSSGAAATAPACASSSGTIIRKNTRV